MASERTWLPCEWLHTHLWTYSVHGEGEGLKAPTESHHLQNARHRVPRNLTPSSLHLGILSMNIVNRSVLNVCSVKPACYLWVHATRSRGCWTLVSEHKSNLKAWGHNKGQNLCDVGNHKWLSLWEDMLVQFCQSFSQKQNKLRCHRVSKINVDIYLSGNCQVKKKKLIVFPLTSPWSLFNMSWNHVNR